jgi:hypothetical protein
MFYAVIASCVAATVLSLIPKTIEVDNRSSVALADTETPVVAEIPVEVPKEPEYIQSYEEMILEVFPDAPIMVRIAKCESRLRQYGSNGEALRGEQNPLDRGLFQINEKYHLKNAIDMGIDIHTPEGNILYARYLYDRNGTRDWAWSQKCWG